MLQPLSLLPQVFRSKLRRVHERWYHPVVWVLTMPSTKPYCLFRANDNTIVETQSKPATVRLPLVDDQRSIYNSLLSSLAKKPNRNSRPTWTRFTPSARPATRALDTQSKPLVQSGMARGMPAIPGVAAHYSDRPEGFNVKAPQPVRRSRPQETQDPALRKALCCGAGTSGLLDVFLI